MRRNWTGILLVTVGLVSAPVGAQQARRAPAMSVEESTALTQGWALLAQGLFDDALTSATETLRRFPRNQSALALVVEVAIARHGARDALDRYERWLAGRATEDVFTLKRVGRAVLWEAIRQPEGGARSDALKALLADGDPDASAEVAQAVEEGGLADTVLLASMGDPGAVQRLGQRLNGEQPVTLAVVRALGESRQGSAAASLMMFLKDGRPEFRAAAARGLGQIRARQAVESLRGLLQDMHPDVRLQAAAALWLMDDAAGTTELRQFEESEHPAIRLAALQATAGKPDGTWSSRARSLLQAEDPAVRVQAAALVSKEDPMAARQTFEALAGHENAAIREMAQKGVAESTSGDLPMLRALLRHEAAPVRVAAASRLLDAVR